MPAEKKQIVGFDEATWEILQGRGRRMCDFATQDFVATMDLERVWTVTVIDADNREPGSAAVWWDDHCDDEGRSIVRGRLPFHAIAGPRNKASVILHRVQKAFDMWKYVGCPEEFAA